MKKLFLFATLMVLSATLPACALANANSPAANNWDLSKVPNTNAAPSAEDQAYLLRLQKAVKDGNKAFMADQVASYPLIINNGFKRYTVKSKAEFVSNYDFIVNQPVRDAVLKQDPGTMFVKPDSGVMIGQGQVWFTQGHITQINNVDVNAYAKQMATAPKTPAAPAAPKPAAPK